MDTLVFPNQYIEDNIVFIFSIFKLYFNNKFIYFSN